MPEEASQQPTGNSPTLRLVRAAVIVIAVLAIVAVFSPHNEPHTAKLKPPARRNPLETFRLSAISGPAWTLEEHRGEVVLVNFWATWCGPCRRETPELVQVSQRYAPAGLRVVGITMDDNPNQVVPPFIKRYQIPYPILRPDSSFALASSIASLPTTLLVDRQGKIARTWVGSVTAEELTGDIEELLREKL